jgi:hypothetical protein
MEKNYKLSKELNIKYKAKKNECTDNSFKICKYEKLDLCIGFIEHENYHFIHLWNIHNNKIVDTTLPDDEKDYNYIEIMRINNFDVIKKKISDSYKVIGLIEKKLSILKEENVGGFSLSLATNFKIYRSAKTEREFCCLSALAMFSENIKRMEYEFI